MPTVGLTFGLACVSAAFFLWLRSEDKGLALGPRSRLWALAVTALTGALSTALAFVLHGLANVVGNDFPSYVSHVGLGAVMPSTLWLAEIRQGGGERRNPYRDALTLWLSWLLRRLDEGMVEDKEEWCRDHIVVAWSTDELIMAAHYYEDYLRERLSALERSRYRLNALIQAIESRLDIARLIEDNPRLTNGGVRPSNGSTRGKVSTALTTARLSQERYKRSLDDLTRLAQLLRNDARQDLIRLLRVAYRAGLRRLPVYQPPRGPEPPASQRSHP
jgi:hypothetical protein